jgi:hypothetical protein
MTYLVSKLLFVPTVAFTLLSMIPFQHQLVNGSLLSSTDQSGNSSATNSSASSLDIMVDNNQTLSPLSNSTRGLHQDFITENSTNSTLSVNDSAWSLAQKQDLMSLYIRQHQPSNGTDIQSQQNQQQSQSYTPPPVRQQQLQQQQQQPLSQSQPQPQPPPQTYTYTPPAMQQQYQQQPLAQPYPAPAPPLYTIPYNPSLSQITEVPPRILSYTSYFDSIGSMHIVGEVINESFEPMSFVKITATFYDVNNGVIGTDFTFTSPLRLEPGQRAPFDMTVMEGSIPIYMMAYYALSVDYTDLSR